MEPELVDRAVLKVLARVRKALLRSGLQGPDKGILCAVSGGVDSVALLHALCLLRKDPGFFVGAAHLNHCLRGAEADKDADFVKNLCSSLDLKLHIEKTDVLRIARSRGLGVEEAGRNIRYAFLERVRSAYGYTVIALGHHGDDNAQTVLLNLLRGAGPQGLSGMDEQSGSLFRPLLGLYRNDILAFAQALSLEFVEDSSNQDMDFTRNRVRDFLIPLLEENFNPSIKKGLNRLAFIMSQENNWMELEAKKAFEQCLMEQGPSFASLSAQSLSSFHPALGRRVLREAVRRLKGELLRLEWGHVDDALKLAQPSKQSGQAHLPGGLVATRRGQRLFVEARENPAFRSHVLVKESVQPVSVTPTPPGAVIFCPDGPVVELVPQKAGADPLAFAIGAPFAVMDMDTLSLPLVLRPAQKTDRIRPLGMKGSKTVFGFVADRLKGKIKPKTVWIMESGGCVAWAVGFGIDGRFGVRADSANLLVCRLVK
ncbi:MAG: tRNA lysidine(34) synthetase TilS [Desulfatibacillaceae bacterium]|nr:tRNA lysidine(34) synthetase TilS [Desulfatibacillaceae bacterium]